MLATNLRKTGRFPSPKVTGPAQLRPTSINDLKRYLEPDARTALPIRPLGAGTAATDCSRTNAGSIVHMSGIDRIIRVDAQNHTVTVEAGLRLQTLVDTLAEDGLELVGGFELQGRTVGGAIAAPCFGACIGTAGSYFSSYVVAMKVITANGNIMSIEAGQKDLLAAFRMSFGLLGIIYEVKIGRAHV